MNVVPRVLPQDIVKAKRLRLARRGIVYPATTVAEARRAGLDLAVACAVLIQETAGGVNEFGHDPVSNPVKGGLVTQARYLEYLHHRNLGQGSQGVGPMQLTWGGYQDEADRIGGCWKPWLNMRVGFGILAGKIKSSRSLEEGLAAYNGAGAAAAAYGRQVAARARAFDAAGVR